MVKRKLPYLMTDLEAEAFPDSADLSEFDLSVMRPHTFEFALISRQINIRVPEALLDAMKAEATAQGISCQRFTRQKLEAAIARRRYINWYSMVSVSSCPFDHGLLNAIWETGFHTKRENLREL